MQKKKVVTRYIQNYFCLFYSFQYLLYNIKFCVTLTQMVKTRYSWGDEMINSRKDLLKLPRLPPSSIKQTPNRRLLLMEHNLLENMRGTARSLCQLWKDRNCHLCQRWPLYCYILIPITMSNVLFLNTFNQLKRYYVATQSFSYHEIFFYHHLWCAQHIWLFHQQVRWLTFPGIGKWRV